jgi:hypothetical protein
VAETLKRVELVPLRGLGVINFKGNDLTNLVSTTANDEHKRAEEKSGVLVAGGRLLSSSLIRGLYPVPSPIAVASQTPAVIEGALIGGTATEDHHHACGTTSLAEGCRVIHSDGRVLFSAIEFNPREGCLLNAETPDITNWLLTSITSEDEQMRLREDDRMTIAAAWG